MKQIIETIKKTIEPLMMQWAADRTAFILNAKKNSDEECKEKNVKGRDAWACFAIAKKHGLTKTTLQWLSFGAAYVAEQCQKDAIFAMKKVDIAVAKKLKGIEVKSAELIKLGIGEDGFAEGAWKLDNGKWFEFETIYAGGYNIQCLHVRTIYTLK